MYIYKTLDHCLLCGSHSVPAILPLQPISIATPNFTVPQGLDTDALLQGVPLAIHQCGACGHLQVGQIGNPDLQYRDYVYTTRLSPGLADHFKAYAHDVIDRIEPAPESLVVDIGSNDGTLLRFFKERGMRVAGVDPATRIAQEATAAGIPTAAEFFSEEVAQKIVAAYGPASVVIANNMIANVHDLPDFAGGIRKLLAPDGVFIFETQYGRDIFERHLLDTVYHEHLSYFLVKPTTMFYRRHGMQVIDVVRTSSKGGSIRVTVQREGGPKSEAPIVDQLCREEEAGGVYSASFSHEFKEAIANIRRELEEIVDGEHQSGREVAGYGVSVGTLTLLAQFGLTNKIDFMVDDDPQKEPFLQGPGYKIPVIPADEVAKRRPGAGVVFAWRYARRIAERQRAYLDAGGKLVVPLPEVTCLR